MLDLHHFNYIGKVFSASKIEFHIYTWKCEEKLTQYMLCSSSSKHYSIELNLSSRRIHLKVIAFKGNLQSQMCSWQYILTVLKKWQQNQVVASLTSSEKPSPSPTVSIRTSPTSQNQDKSPLTSVANLLDCVIVCKWLENKLNEQSIQNSPTRKVGQF